MHTLINGRPAMDVIEEDVLKTIQNENPNIHIEDYKEKKDIPGFIEIMSRPKAVSLEQTDKKLYISVLQKLNRMKKLHKGAALDLRRDAEGHETVAAVKNGKDLWEVAIGWDIIFEK